MQIKQGEDFKWEIQTDLGTVLLNDLTIADLIWMSSEGLDLEVEPLGIILLYDRMVIKDQEEFLVSDLPIAEYNDFLNLFMRNVLEGKVCSVDSAMDLLWFLGGQSFHPNVQEWFKIPMTLIAAMASVARKYPKQTL